jgi:hypothetical protein
MPSLTAESEVPTRIVCKLTAMSLPPSRWPHPDAVWAILYSRRIYRTAAILPD